MSRQRDSTRGGRRRSARWPWLPALAVAVLALCVTPDAAGLSSRASQRPQVEQDAGVRQLADALERLGALVDEVEDRLFGEAAPRSDTVVPSLPPGRSGPRRGHGWRGRVAELERELDAIPRSGLPLESRITYDVVAYAVSRLDLRARRPDYREQILFHTTLPLRAGQLQRLGLREVERLRERMERVRQEVGFEGDLEDFLAHLRRDELYYADGPEAFVAAARWIVERSERRVGELFGRVPRTPVRVDAFTDPAAPAAAYRAGSIGGETVPGRILLNTEAVGSRPLWALEAILLHEGMPGHHLQQMLALENDEIPLLQRRLAVTPFVEGWGLYAEGLGEDLGLYEDPYRRFGYLHSRMWRACRLVVDTGLHAFDWSESRAREFMARNLAFPDREIAVEVERYAENPGQALSYLMGALTLEELRREAESELGSDFDLAAFHDEILRHGAMPLPTLVEVAEVWIARRATSRRR